MKLQDLKDKTWDIWLLLHECSEAVPQPENFKPEVRAFGDLRYRDTWKQALGHFMAMSIVRSVLEPVSLVTFYLNPPRDDWSWEVRRETFEAYIRIPGALELVREGLNEIFGSPSSYQGEDLNGIFELVENSARVRGLLPGS